MKKARKGFTLIELLVVIAIMGILGASVMISGQEATSAARAANIADGLEKASIAMMSYYAENCESIDATGVLPTTTGTGGDAKTTTAEDKIAAGANAYIKDANALIAYGTDDTKVVGKYAVKVVGTDMRKAEWWVVYTFDEDATGQNKIKAIMGNKAARMGLMKAVPTAINAAANPYDGAKDSNIVCMKVR